MPQTPEKVTPTRVAPRVEGRAISVTIPVKKETGLVRVPRVTEQDVQVVIDATATEEARKQLVVERVRLLAKTDPQAAVEQAGKAGVSVGDLMQGKVTDLTNYKEDGKLWEILQNNKEDFEKRLYAYLELEKRGKIVDHEEVERNEEGAATQVMVNGKSIYLERRQKARAQSQAKEKREGEANKSFPTQKDLFKYVVATGSLDESTTEWKQLQSSDSREREEAYRTLVRAGKLQRKDGNSITEDFYQDQENATPPLAWKDISGFLKKGHISLQGERTGDTVALYGQFSSPDYDEAARLVAFKELSLRGALKIDATAYAALVAKDAVQRDKDIVYENARLTDDARKRRAAEVLGRSLTPEQEIALIEAHEFASGGIGKDGSLAEVYNFTMKQLGAKMKILREAHFSEDEIKLLLRLGLAGTLPQIQRRLQRRAERGTLTEEDLAQAASELEDLEAGGDMTAARVLEGVEAMLADMRRRGTPPPVPPRPPIEDDEDLPPRGDVFPPGEGAAELDDPEFRYLPNDSLGMRKAFKEAMTKIFNNADKEEIKSLAFQSGLRREASDIDILVKKARVYADLWQNDTPENRALKAEYRQLAEELRSMRNVLGNFQDIVAFSVTGLAETFNQVVPAANAVNVKNAFFLMRELPGFAPGVRYFYEAVKQQLLNSPVRRLTDREIEAARSDVRTRLIKWYNDQKGRAEIEIQRLNDEIDRLAEGDEKTEKIRKRDWWMRVSHVDTIVEAEFMSLAADRYSRAGLLVHAVLGGEWGELVEGSMEEARNPLWGPATSQFAFFTFNLGRYESLPEASHKILDFIGRDKLDRMVGQRNFHGSAWRSFFLVREMVRRKYAHSGLFMKLKHSFKDEDDFQEKLKEAEEIVGRLKHQKEQSLKYDKVKGKKAEEIVEAEEKFAREILQGELYIRALRGITKEEKATLFRRSLLDLIAIYEPHKIAEQYFGWSEMDNLIRGFGGTGTPDERLREGRRQFYAFSERMAEARERAFAEGRDIQESDIDAVKNASELDRRMYNALYTFATDPQHMAELMDESGWVGLRRNVNYGNLGDESDIPQEILQEGANDIHSKPYGRMWGDIADGHQAAAAMKAVFKHPTDMKAFAQLKGKFVPLIYEKGEKKVIAELTYAVMKFNMQSEWLNYAPPGVGRFLNFLGIRISPAEKGLGVLAPAWGIGEALKRIDELVKEDVIDYKDAQKLKNILGITWISRSIPLLYMILMATVVGLLYEMTATVGLKIGR